MRYNPTSVPFKSGSLWSAEIIYARIHDYIHKVTTATSSYYIYQNKGDDFYQLTEPSKTGYEFYGWYIDENMDGVYDYSIPYDENYVVTSDVDIYAKFGAIRLDVEVQGPYVGEDMTVKVPTGGFVVQTDIDKNYADEDKLYVPGDSYTIKLTEPETVDDMYFEYWEVEYDEDDNVLIVPIYSTVVTISVKDTSGEEVSLVEINSMNSIIECDEDGTPIKEHVLDNDSTEVSLGEPAEKPGYVFNEWVPTVLGSGDVAYTPTYLELMPVEIYEDNVLVDTVEVPESKNIIVLDFWGNETATEVTNTTEIFELDSAKDVYNYVFAGWDVDQTGDDVIITPIYAAIVTVEIKDEEGNVIGSYTIVEGNDIVVDGTTVATVDEDLIVNGHFAEYVLDPAVVKDGYAHTGWIVDDSGDDIVITPVYTVVVTVEIRDDNGGVLDTYDVLDGTSITVIDTDGKATTVVVDETTNVFELPEVIEVDEYNFVDWEIVVTDDEMIIKPIYKKIVYKEIEIYDIQENLIDTYKVSSDTDVTVYCNDDLVTGSNTVTVDQESGEVLPISTIGMISLMNFSHEVEMVLEDAVFNKFDESDPEKVIVVLKDPAEVTDHTFEKWTTELVAAQISIVPTYLTNITIDIKDEEDNILVSVDTFVEKEIIVYDKEGNPTKATINADDTEFKLPTAAEVAGFEFDGWEVVLNDNNDIVITPIYKSLVEDANDNTSQDSSDDTSNDGTEIPATGDATSIWLLYLALCMSLMGIFISLVKRRKE